MRKLTKTAIFALALGISIPSAAIETKISAKQMGSCIYHLVKSPHTMFTVNGHPVYANVVTDHIFGGSFYVLTTFIENADGTIKKVEREVPVDSLTQGIDANSSMGKIFLRSMLEEGKTMAKGMGVVFIDLNDLGLVNYFSDQMNAGNKYIEGVGHAIHNVIRDKDMLFRIGGDEWMLLLPHISERSIIKLIQRIHLGVTTNPHLNSFFDEELKQVDDTLKSPTALDALDDKHIENLKKMINLKPSVSMSSTFLDKSDSFETLLERLNQQATEVKTRYKVKMGRETAKYRSQEGAFQIEPIEWDINSDELPEVFPPVYLGPRPNRSE